MGEVVGSGKYSESSMLSGISSFLNKCMGMTDEDFMIAYIHQTDFADNYDNSLKELASSPMRVRVEDADFIVMMGDDMAFVRGKLNYVSGDEVFMSFSDDGGILVEVVSGGDMKQHVFNNSGYRMLARYVMEKWERDKSAAKGVSVDVTSEDDNTVRSIRGRIVKGELKSSEDIEAAIDGAEFSSDDVREHFRQVILAIFEGGGYEEVIEGVGLQIF